MQNSSDMRLSSFHSLVEDIRWKQIDVAEEYAREKFPVPVHLALGHEWIAAALRTAFGDNDALVLSHRNLHYQFAFGAESEIVIDEFRLQPEGIAAGLYGSMNLVQPGRGLVYTSSILGNNLPVSVGIGLAKRVQNVADCVWVVTGDGAMEEGAFYEALLLAKSMGAPVAFIVEDNEWSLATSVSERRCQIDLQMLARSLGIPSFQCSENEWESSPTVLSQVRDALVHTQSPVVLRASLTTLGGRWVEDPSRPEGKRFINYHAGPLDSPERFAPGTQDPEPTDFLAGVPSNRSDRISADSHEAAEVG